MGWEMGNGEKKELSLISNNTSEFPILIHTAKWFQVRSQGIKSKSAQALTQSNSSQEPEVPHLVILQSGHR